MKMARPAKILGAAILLFFLCPTLVRSQEEAPCEALKNAQDILHCILQKYPDIQRTEAEIAKKSAATRVDVEYATRWREDTIGLMS